MSHIWNNGVLGRFRGKVTRTPPCARVRALGYVTYVPWPPRLTATCATARADAQANYFETSVMLHLYPELVRMDRATSTVTWTHSGTTGGPGRETGVWGRDVADANAAHPCRVRALHPNDGPRWSPPRRRAVADPSHRP